MSPGPDDVTTLVIDLAAAEVGALLDGVVVVEDALALASVPAGPQALADGIDLVAVGGPVGIAVGPDGTVAVADPAGSRILIVPTCADRATPIACLTGPGRDPGRVWSPRGVAIGRRGELVVADTLNHRVQAVHLSTGALRWVRGPADPYAPPRPGSGPGELDTPWDVAVDADGRLYVADRGNRRVQRYLSDGAVDAVFAAALDASRTTLREPVGVVIGRLEGEDRLLVLDRGPNDRCRLVVHSLDGFVDTTLTERWRLALASAAPGGVGPLGAGIAVGGGRVYVGDATGGRVVVLAEDGALIGIARHVGPVAGLALDLQGRLLVHPGGGEPVRLSLTGAVRAGTFRVGPITLPEGAEEPVRWWRLEVLGAQVPEGTQVRLYSLTSDRAEAPPPLIPDDEGTAETPVPAGTWAAGPVGALDLLMPNAPGAALWIGGRLRSTSDISPRLAAIRVEAGETGWLRHLPGVYSREGDPDALRRLLAALESALREEEALVDELPLLLRAAEAPDTDDAPWLDWLGGWLGIELGSGRQGPWRRELVATGFDLHARRGTAGGLRELARIALGLEIDVTEPAAGVRIWALGGGELGFGTMLRSAQADGATLGTTAELNRSHLLEREQYGAPLYGDLAHRAIVRALAADLPDEDDRRALETLVAREVPAHVAAHVCLIEPRARVGVQAVLGVDAIVAGAARPFVLGSDALLGAGALGGAESGPERAREGVRVGRGQVT